MGTAERVVEPTELMDLHFVELARLPDDDTRVIAGTDDGRLALVMANYHQTVIGPMFNGADGPHVAYTEMARLIFDPTGEQIDLKRVIIRGYSLRCGYAPKARMWAVNAESVIKTTNVWGHEVTGMQPVAHKIGD